jgi:hypothetical protein
MIMMMAMKRREESSDKNIHFENGIGYGEGWEKRLHHDYVGHVSCVWICK